jgi:RNA polymerase sigma-70 factor (ECF subfamily)
MPRLPWNAPGKSSTCSIFAVITSAQFAQLALVDGVAVVVWAPGGRLCVVFSFTKANGTISAIKLTADPERLRRLDVAILTD